MVRERTKAGLASARRRGRKGGRRKAIDCQTFSMALQLYEAQTRSVQSICDHFGMANARFIATWLHIEANKRKMHNILKYSALKKTFSAGDSFAHFGPGLGETGGLWGGFWGLLVGSGFFFIPGIGPLMVFGPLVSWIIGALEGAVVVGG